jgi:hypothetical protein
MSRSRKKLNAPVAAIEVARAVSACAALGAMAAVATGVVIAEATEVVLIDVVAVVTAVVVLGRVERDATVANQVASLTRSRYTY